MKLIFDALVPADEGINIEDSVYFDISGRTVVQMVSPIVHFRKCYVGEYYDFLETRSKCTKCANRQYSFLENEDNAVISCTDCIEGAKDCYANVIELYPGVI